MRGTRWLEELGQDGRYGCRSLYKHPGFTVVAVVTLAVGVAATMTVFNLLDALLLRPLPVPNAGELVTLVRWQGGHSSEHFSYPQVRLLAATCLRRSPGSAAIPSTSVRRRRSNRRARRG